MSIITSKNYVRNFCVTIFLPTISIEILLYITSVGFEVAEMLALLDRFCEERMIVDELNQEVKSGNENFPMLLGESSETVQDTTVLDE